MELDNELVERVARLARVKLKDDEVEEFKKDMKSILEMFSKISEVDVGGEGLNPQPVEIKDLLREDSVKKSLGKGDVFKNTKHEESGFFKGPKIK
ncbi:MAG: Asp-tRNA(Asn)/Glu-tRNA(Gln) amidotransferase subunit GatC [Nanoarchaeota archaeon]|nr:Asp-tRNA(Asn)/Glu-tRNA(Gln) amidotransferase subunit GatC [Nanoarchaeota archaeon]